MTFFKFLYHISSLIKLILLKFIYGNRLIVDSSTTWRKGFNVLIDKKASVKIGKNCFFNNYCSINALDDISIGDGCLFGENVKIYDHNHRFNDSRLSIKEQGFSIGKVCIGKHCWIGSNVVILKGTNIGDNCVIGAGAIISQNIEDNTIVKSENKIIQEPIDKEWKNGEVSKHNCSDI